VYVALCRVSVVPHAVWSASRKSTKGAAQTESVVYGDTSGGFFSERPPEPLRAGGCYTVGASGTVSGSNLPARGSGGFRVLPDGSVANGTGELGRRLGNERDVYRAALGCRRGYDRARTLADSTAVDTGAWPVSDTAITCGLLRERDPDTIASAESTGRFLFRVGGWIAVIAAVSMLQDAWKP